MLAAQLIAKIGGRDRLEDQLDIYEPQIRDAFMEMVEGIQSEFTLNELADMIAAGHVMDAVAVVQGHAGGLAEAFNIAYTGTGRAQAAFIVAETDSIMRFSPINDRAVQAMRSNDLRLVNGFTQEQIRTTNAALMEGITEGANPIAQARRFRESIGLTEYQQQIVGNYRRALEGGEVNALQRELRDRRFDRTVRHAIDGKKPLTQKQIDKMVGRYREKWIKYRSESIARTEALRAVHEGAEENWNQAIESRVVAAEDLQRTWNTAADTRVRDSHGPMSGQQRAYGEPFISGHGNALRYPGDSNAPASETIHCRCVLSTRIRPKPAA